MSTCSFATSPETSLRSRAKLFFHDGALLVTTLASDLHQKNQLYVSLGIAEYWVVDVKGSRGFLFQLDDKGQYYEVEGSIVLSGLSTALLEEAMAKLDSMTNMDVALWFKTQIAQAEE